MSQIRRQLPSGKFPLIFPKWSDLPVLATVAGHQFVDDAGYTYTGENKGDNWCLVQITLAGRGYLSIAGKKYCLDKGKAMIVCFPEQMRYFWEEDNEPWELVYINLIGNEAVKVCLELIECIGNVIDLSKDRGVIEKIIHIIWQASEKKITDPYTLSVLCYDFLMTLKKYNSFFKDRNVPQYISDVTTYCRDHLDREITVDELASIAGYSRFYFSRKFKEKMKISPLDFIHRMKMESAVNYLRKGKSVGEVSHLVGYRDVSYFCKVFKKYYNISPGKFYMYELDLK